MRHLPFLKALAKANDSGDQVWRDASPGYLVLRFFDRWLDDGPAVMAADPALPALKGRIRSDALLAPVARKTLLQAVDALVDAPDLNPSPAIEHLFGYGDYLRAAGHISLAGHIYSTVAESLDRVGLSNDPQLGKAYQNLGLTSRLLGEFEVARASYARAEAVASAHNNVEQLFRARFGLGNVLRSQGNLPAAELLLTQIATSASEAGLLVLEAQVRHSLGSVFHMRGRYDDAIRDYYRAYQLLSGAERESILADLAASEQSAGYRDAARDVHRLLSYTAHEPIVRASSLINLIELAVLDNDEALYNRARLDLTAHTQNHQTPAEHMAHAALYIAMGIEQFGSTDAALDAYRAVAAQARQAKINQIEFEAEQKLQDLIERQRHQALRAPSAPALVPPAELQHITNALAVAASSALAMQGF
jgi:tetratricopeptide (TPR) repeat protein